MPTSRTRASPAPTTGSASSGAAGALTRAAFGAMTSRNDGQSPSRQEKSLLQELWWIRVLRPNSVSTGSTDRQPDFSPQSPQPSQTRSLIRTSCGGVAALPRLRARRSSVAQAWSWISTVTPSTAASSFWVRRSSLRGRTS